MKVRIAQILFISATLTLAACGSSDSGGGAGAPVGALTDTGGPRFKATKAPSSTTVHTCDWQENSKMQSDPNLKAGMRFVGSFHSLRGGVQLSGSTEVSIVTAEAKRIVSDLRILSLSGVIPGVRVGMKFRLECQVTPGADGAEDSHCEITPQLKVPQAPGEYCYIVSDEPDAYKTEFTEGTYTMADGRVIPVELETQTHKGTLWCSTSESKAVERGKGEQRRTVVRTKVIPDSNLDVCVGSTEVYSFTEDLEESGRVINSSRNELTTTFGVP